MSTRSGRPLSYTRAIAPPWNSTRTPLRSKPPSRSQPPTITLASSPGEVANRRGGARPEQPADLLGDGVEEPLGQLAGRDRDRDPAQRSLLLREGGEVLARLRVRERDRDELPELHEPLLRVVARTARRP